MAKKFLQVGRIVGTHGIKGELKLENWTDSPDWLKKIKKLYFDNGAKDAGLKSSRVHKNLLLITLDGVTDPSKADELRGTILYMDRSDAKLPRNRYFIQDLIGLKVFDGDNGNYYGVIEDVYMTGANNVYKIVNEDKEYLFPAVDHMIKRTDIDEGVVEVLPIPGIFDEDGITDAN